MIHQLKTAWNYYDAIAAGTKTFEVRKNDRRFVVNDWVGLNSLDVISEKETSECLIARITYVLNDENFCKDGFVVLGLADVKILSPVKSAKEVTP